MTTSRNHQQAICDPLLLDMTGRPTPVPLHDVRLATNIFRGKLGREIAKELARREADVSLYRVEGGM
jgi:hypothetical protein